MPRKHTPDLQFTSARKASPHLIDLICFCWTHKKGRTPRTFHASPGWNWMQKSVKVRAVCDSNDLSLVACAAWTTVSVPIITYLINTQSRLPPNPKLMRITRHNLTCLTPTSPPPTFPLCQSTPTTLSSKLTASICQTVAKTELI